MYPVPSDHPKVLANNSSNIDDAVTGTAATWVDREGVVRPTMKGMETSFDQFLLKSGYEYLGDYDDPGEITFTRRNQTMSKGGEYWRPGPSLALPYTTVNDWAVDSLKFVSNGDNSLRMAIAAATGTMIIGHGNRTLWEKLGEHVSCKDAPFNCVLDGVADDTAGMNLFAQYLKDHTVAGLTTSGSMSAAYTGTSPTGYIPSGTCKLTGKVDFGGYCKLVSDNTIFKQYDPNSDIFDIDLYQFQLEGGIFVGGRQHLRFHNANINSSMIKVDFAQFFLSSDYSIKTLATGGTWTHLSCSAVFNSCRWIANRKIMDNCCDSMVINDHWMQPELSNISASTAQINNRGAYPGDPSAQTRLYMNRGFCIPAVGTYYTTDPILDPQPDRRPANLRWVDNWGSFISKDVRYGGEFGGMRIVDHLAIPDLAFPWNTTEVSITGGMVYCGPSNDPTACVVGLQGQVPNKLTLGGFSGAVSSPLVLNLSSTDLDAYFAAYQGSSGRVATEYFKIDAYDITTDLRNWSPLRPMLPDGLYKYLVKGRNTRLSKSSQSLANAAASNIVSFNTTTDFDSVMGAFNYTTPTRLIMPNGCSKMRIEVDVVIDAGDNLAKAISVQLQTSGGSRWKGVSGMFGYDSKANPFGDGIHFTADVYGPPGTYWELNIKHTGTTARNLIDCRVVMTPIDLIA